MNSPPREQKMAVLPKSTTHCLTLNPVLLPVAQPRFHADPLLGSDFSLLARHARPERRALVAADRPPLAPELGRAGAALAPRPARRVRLGLGPRRILPRPLPRPTGPARAPLGAPLQCPP